MSGHPSAFNHRVCAGYLYRDGKQVGAVALCGHVWAPTVYDYGKPPCTTCERIANPA